MSSRPRHADFSWPVAHADLDALEVLEAVPGIEGGLLWQRPAASPVAVMTLPQRFDPPPVERPAVAHHVTHLERFALLTMGFVVGASLAMTLRPAGEPVRPAATAARPDRAPALTPRRAAPLAAGVVPAATASTVDRTSAPRAAARAESAALTPPAAARSHAGSDPRAAVRSTPRSTPGIAPTRVTNAGALAASRARAEPGDTTMPDVLAAIGAYASAYSRMDATAMQAVWRDADRTQLVQSFSELREQRLTLGSCDVKPSGTSATATCNGLLRYRPRVGEHSTRVRSGRWQFVLGQIDDTWVIHSITAP